MTKIALFGTSADPPTAGHQSILRWLSQRYDTVVVWTASNPFKPRQTCEEHRVAMLRLLIIEINSPQHNILLEQELSSTRTLETLEKAKQRWGKNSEFTLVVGSDLLTQLPIWYKVQDLLQQAQLLVVQRPGYAIDKSRLEAVQKLGGNITIAEFTGPDISSTGYRENGDINALTPLVADYIQQQHLYQKCQDETIKRLQLR
ncbi:MAG: nicotinate-nucleotide adenylyltransferase [Scytonematopsis contorta HA4267-MV1]|jgi:nicotinate-nucleotide adenylyltransferase|nr:nicotinate-nucleotide adenylyltransferase [Scytonematopsis contorta HA4267-MV1]